MKTIIGRDFIAIRHDQWPHGRIGVVSNMYFQARQTANLMVEQ